MILAGSLAAPRPLVAGDGTSLKDHLRFASDMARRGNWREARYRWSLALEKRPDDPRLLNNMAVAHEALGEWDEASATYERIASRFARDERVRENLRRHERFRRTVLDADEEASENGTDERPSRAELAETARIESSGKGKGKAFRVAVKLPVPPRIDIASYDTLLVASFLHDESALLDINRELTRFLRGRMRRTPGLEVLDVTPAPAIPEQTLQDLAINREFWRHLGREYEADLIVSGQVTFIRSDVSGFRDVDIVSPVTGQKVRQSRFVEQEEFNYAVDVLFFDGATGDLLIQDRFQRAAIFRGANNDPITAFYELSEAIANDAIGIVRSRTREDVRFVFRE